MAELVLPQEKGLTMKAGQTPCQKYWHKLLDMIESGKLNPQVVISHEGPLTAAPMLYKLFNDKQDDCVKVLRPMINQCKRPQWQPYVVHLICSHCILAYGLAGVARLPMTVIGVCPSAAHSSACCRGHT